MQRDRDVVALLKVCGERKDLHRGALLHAYSLKTGLFEQNSYVAGSVVNMYAKCGVIRRAQEVLDEIPFRDVVSWTALITGYTQQEQDLKALQCFDLMQCEGHSPNAVTFICALKACGFVGAADKGEQIHEEILRQGLLERDIVLGCALLDMYVKCGALVKAHRVLDKLTNRNAVSWTVLITGYSHYEQGEQALACFEQMQCEGNSPTPVTFSCILKACGSIGITDEGRQIHNEIVKKGLLEKNVELGNAVVDMYAKCGALMEAQQVFSELYVQNAVSWNALITGFTQQGQGHEALNCIELMQYKGFSPDAVTYACALNICALIRAADKGEQIHDEITRQGLLQGNVKLGNALVDMYASCGKVDKAWGVLDGLLIRDVITWNVIITGCTEQGMGEEALICLKLMQCDGLSPDMVTFLCALKACGSIGAVDKGKEIHDEIASVGFLKKNTVLSTALIDMYIKCGALTIAQQVLDELSIRDVVSWSALITGYAQKGHSGEVLKSFKEMECEGLSPDAGVLVCVLNACTHSGLLDMGQVYFTQIGAKYGITPNVKHYCCMVDLFSRAGEFNKALSMIKKMTFCDYPPAWHTMLAGCQKWENVTLGRMAFEHAIHVERDDTATYICMVNIYAAARMQDDAHFK